MPLPVGQGEQLEAFAGLKCRRGTASSHGCHPYKTAPQGTVPQWPLSIHGHKRVRGTRTSGSTPLHHQRDRRARCKHREQTFDLLVVCPGGTQWRRPSHRRSRVCKRQP